MADKPKPVMAPLKRCPKCGHPGGLIFCPVCHEEYMNSIKKENQ